jgi:hypothetical protein
VTRGPPLVINCASCPGVSTAYAQAARFSGPQGSATSVDGIVRLAKAFLELPTARLSAMQRQAMEPKQKARKASSTVHGPSRRQVLIASEPFPEGGVNPSELLEAIRRSLSMRRSKLTAQSVSTAYGGYSIATDGVATSDDLQYIVQGATVVFPTECTVSADLPTSTSYLKLVDVPYFWPVATTIPITVEVVLSQMAKAGLKDDLILTGPPLDRSQLSRVGYGDGVSQCR